MKAINSFVAALLISIASVASAEPPDPREIMIKVDKVANHSYLSSGRILQLSTCRYQVAKGKLACKEKPRVLKIESVHKGYNTPGFPDKSNKAFDVIIDPISDKGTAMLSWGYADDKKDSDFWVYLPALAKVKRIVSVSDNNESGAVFGSELSTEDADVKRIKDYTYRLIGEDVYRARPVWVIEMIPTAYRRTRSYYSKIIASVDKERFVVLKEDLHDRSGRHYKQRSALVVRKVDGVWLVTKGSMNNLYSKRITQWDELKIGLNFEVDDEFVSQRSLTDFAYRERLMEKYRASIK